MINWEISKYKMVRSLEEGEMVFYGNNYIGFFLGEFRFGITVFRSRGLFCRIRVDGRLYFGVLGIFLFLYFVENVLNWVVVSFNFNFY